MDMLQAAKDRYSELEGFINQKKSEIAGCENEMKALKTYLVAMGALKAKRTYRIKPKPE